MRGRSEQEPIERALGDEQPIESARGSRGARYRPATAPRTPGRLTCLVPVPAAVFARTPEHPPRGGSRKDVGTRCCPTAAEGAERGRPDFRGLRPGFLSGQPGCRGAPSSSGTMGANEDQEVSEPARDPTLAPLRHAGSEA